MNERNLTFSENSGATGCPTSNQTASMDLNYDLGDKSENLRRMNHFEKFNRANRNFFSQKMLDFWSILYVYFGIKDWRKSDMIGDALY